jgi:tRNA(His) 5'-end guanylyltransferase
MLGQDNFSHDELQGKSCNDVQEMLFQKDETNWNNIPQEQKSGFVALRQSVGMTIPAGPEKGGIVFRDAWKPQPGPSSIEELRGLFSKIVFEKPKKLDMPSVDQSINEVDQSINESSD